MVLNNSINANIQGFQSLNATTGIWNGRTLQAGTNITITNPDGTAGNPIISASGGSSNTFGTVDLYDDFLTTASSGSVLTGLLSWAFSGTAVQYQSIDSGHPGIIQLVTTTDVYITAGANGRPQFNLGIGILTIQILFKIVTLSSAGARYTLRLGLGSDQSAADQTNGCYFEYTDNVNSGNWTIKTAKSSVRTTANTSTAANTNWNTFKIVANAAGTSVDYFINGVLVANSPIITNVPTALITPFFSATQSAGTQAFLVDLVTMNMPLTISR